MSVGEDVDALSYEQIAKILKDIVSSVKANGSAFHVPDILHDWSLIQRKCVRCDAKLTSTEVKSACRNCGEFMPTTEGSDRGDDPDYAGA